MRVCYYNTWASELEPVPAYLARVPTLEIAAMVSNPHEAKLLRMGRLDCDWYAENARCFASLTQPGIDFLPAWVCGPKHLIDFASAPREPREERWLITMGHQPQSLQTVAGKVFGLLAKVGIRHVYYAFDEASRCMPCFGEIAPYLDLLIHDESPLDEPGRARLKPSCRTIHRSWVANVVPFAPPFNESPEEKIMFLGSPLGLTEHRKRQIAFLQARFKDRFLPSYDHSPAEHSRFQLNRFKVALCPEGRKFTTPAMAKTHTDRPFWSGCIGLAVVSEDSRTGGRLEDLHAQQLILRYPYGDLAALATACERALAMPNEERRRIYEHFNRHETVGTVVAEAIASV